MGGTQYRSWRTWFLTQAESIGRRFDRRNRSHYFEDDLAAALRQCTLSHSSAGNP